jgi:hypothetical protein
LPIGGIAPLAPGIKAQCLLNFALRVGNEVDTTQMIKE